MSLQQVRVLFLNSVLILSALSAREIFAAETSPKDISITTFNIKYYGLNGDHDGEPGSEQRDNTIIGHMNRYNLWSDVIVFQEIVDVPALKWLLSDYYSCRSYDNQDTRHQHVVICYDKRFTFSMASDDDNFTMENVQMEKYRPVVHGILKTRSGQRLLHIMGVHLKAQPQCSDIREKQTKMISQYIKERADDEPVVVVGDFNTHANDVEIMSGLYKKPGVNLQQVKNAAQFTYRVGSNGSILDHFWISNSLRLSELPKVSGPCNTVSNTSQILLTYNQQVSDHCPVTITIKDPTTAN